MDLIIRLFNFISKYILALVLVFYSMTVGLFTKKGRSFLVNILNYYNVTFMQVSITTKLPNIAYGSVITKERIEIIEPIEKDGNVTLDEIAIINGIIKNENPNSIFEIGTYDGRTSLNMAYNSNDNCQIYTLDLPKEELESTKYRILNYDKTLIDKDIYGERIIKSTFKCKNKIQQLYGDSATYDFTPYYDSIDVVFIDGAHDFDNALNDSETAFKLITKNRGVILWHDYKNNVPVVNALESFKKLHPNLEIYHIERTNLAYCKMDIEYTRPTPLKNS